MAAALSDFIPYVGDDSQGAPDIVQERAIRDAIIDLCRRTNWWTVNLAAISLVAGTKTYTLTPPTESSIARAIKVSMVDTGREVTLMDRDTLDRVLPNWETTVAAGTDPVYWFHDSPGVIRIVPIPTADSVTAALQLLVRVALMPTRTTEVIDDRFLLEAREAVRAGALWRLLDTSKPWGNPQRARQFRQEFDNYVAEFLWRVATADGKQIVVAQTGGFGMNPARNR